MPRFAANLSMMFTELDFLDRFRAAAQAGFKAVEYLFPFDYEPAEIKRRLADNGLKQVLFNAPPGDWARGDRGIAILPGREAEFRAGIAKAIDYARALAVPRVHVMAGIVPTGLSLQDAESTYVANLHHAGEAMKPHGIKALIEPLNTRDNPGYFLSRTEEAARIIGRCGSDNVGLQYDCYHRQIMQGDLAEGFRAHLPLIGHVQIAGVPGRHEPDVGEINHPFLFDLMDTLGYDGWIGCEYRPKNGTDAGLGWAARHGIRNPV